MVTKDAIGAKERTEEAFESMHQIGTNSFLFSYTAMDLGDTDTTYKVSAKIWEAFLRINAAATSTTAELRPLLRVEEKERPDSISDCAKSSTYSILWNAESGTARKSMEVAGILSGIDGRIAESGEERFSDYQALLRGRAIDTAPSA